MQYVIIGFVVILTLTSSGLLVYKSKYQSKTVQLIEAQKNHETFIDQAEEIQKNIATRQLRRIKAAEAKADEWRKKHESKILTINNLYAADKLRRDKERSLRSNERQRDKEPDNLQGVRCGIGESGRTGNFEKYYRRNESALARLQTGADSVSDRIFGELGKPLELCQTELEKIKSSIRDVELIEQ